MTWLPAARWLVLALVCHDPGSRAVGPLKQGGLRPSFLREKPFMRDSTPSFLATVAEGEHSLKDHATRRKNPAIGRGNGEEEGTAEEGLPNDSSSPNFGGGLNTGRPASFADVPVRERAPPPNTIRRDSPPRGPLHRNSLLPQLRLSPPKPMEDGVLLSHPHLSKLNSEVEDLRELRHQDTREEETSGEQRAGGLPVEGSLLSHIQVGVKAKEKQIFEQLLTGMMGTGLNMLHGPGQGAQQPGAMPPAVAPMPMGAPGMAGYPHPQDAGLSTVEIVLIISGGILGIGVVTLLVWLVVSKKKKRSRR